MSTEHEKEQAELAEISDEEAVEFIVEQDFTKWVDGFSADGASTDEMLNDFCKRNGLQRTSPIALMYLGFAGGYGYGMIFESKLQELADQHKSA